MVLNAWKAWVQTPESEVKGAGREPLGSSGGKASLTNGEAEAQKVKDSSRWKNNPDRKSQPSDSGLRSLFLWWPQKSLVLGHFLILCVARPLLGGAARSGHSHSLVASGNPWRWTASCFQEGKIEVRHENLASGEAALRWWNRKDIRWEVKHMFYLPKLWDDPQIPPHLRCTLVFHLHNQSGVVLSKCF